MPNFDTDLAAYENIAPAEGVEKVQQIRTKLVDYKNGYLGTLIPQSNRNEVAAFQASVAPVAAIGAEILTLINEAKDSEQRFAQAALSDSTNAYRNARVWMLAVLGLGTAAGIGVAWLLGRSTSRPMTETVQVLRRVAQGQLNQQVQVNSSDDVGHIGTAINQAVQRFGQVIRDVESSASKLGRASQALTRTATTLSSSADQSASQAGSVASLAEVVSFNVNTVAAGSEEMWVSIREISSNANEAAQVASRAVLVADATNATVSKLGESSREIGNVIKVITSIAGQTNLLALNATIEAARAGEAGKGFAVVANEVKDLAQETAKATEDIARRVEAIQTDRGGAVEAIGQISTIIGQINDFQTTIASAVEEQTATTNEMSRNVAQAAGGSGQIASTIAGMAGAAQETTTGAAHTAQAAEQLSTMADELKQAVSQFSV